eukprot:4631616-Amphidinium_carterae.2
MACHERSSTPGHSMPASWKPPWHAQRKKCLNLICLPNAGKRQHAGMPLPGSNKAHCLLFRVLSLSNKEVVGATKALGD